MSGLMLHRLADLGLAVAGVDEHDPPPRASIGGAAWPPGRGSTRNEPLLTRGLVPSSSTWSVRSRSGTRWTWAESHSSSPMANLFEQSWLPAVKIRSEPSWRRNSAGARTGGGVERGGVAQVHRHRARAVLVDDRPEPGGDVVEGVVPGRLDEGAVGVARDCGRSTRAGSWCTSRASRPLLQANPAVTGWSLSGRSRLIAPLVVDLGDQPAADLAQPAVGGAGGGHPTLLAVLGDDGGELGGGGAVHDHAVAAEVELAPDGGDALLGRAGGAGLEPLVGDERGGVLELLGRADHVEARARRRSPGRRGSGRARRGPSRWCAPAGRRSPGGRCRGDRRSS